MTGGKGTDLPDHRDRARARRGLASWAALPAALVAADVAVRWRVVKAFAPVEWACYAASAVAVFTGFWLLLKGLRALRAKSKLLYFFALVPAAVFGVAVTGAGYGAYAANGDLPDMFLLAYIRCETENALILFRDSFRWHQGALLGVLVAGVAAWVDWLCRLGDGAPPRGRRGLWTLVFLFWAALWVCWAQTASRGQCFVPLARIPMVGALYGLNEIKGINRKPIMLPERQPEEVAARLPKPPANVLIILNESLRRQSLGIYGNLRPTTPFMAEFAAAHPDRFFKFGHAYTNSTTTLLSVPSILTGISPLQPLAMRARQPLLWQWARAAGMESFYFTSHEMAWCGIGRFITTPAPDRFWEQRMENLPRYRDLGIDDHVTVERAAAHLRELATAGRPFLGVVHINTNHYPYNTRGEYRRWSGSDADLYDNTVLETDTHVRRLVETLQAAGRLDDTIVIFASDHGEAFNEHGYTAHFYCHFVETVSVPLWIYLPPSFSRGRDPAALRKNLGETVQNLDILPTVLDSIGAWDRADTAALRAPLLGSSLLRPLPGGRTVFITNKDETLDSVIGLSSITGSSHYMLRTSGTPPKEDLYDLTADPAEQHNLWPATPAAGRDAIRRRFLQFRIAGETMLQAFPELKSGP